MNLNIIIALNYKLHICFHHQFLHFISIFLIYNNLSIHFMLEKYSIIEYSLPYFLNFHEMSLNCYLQYDVLTDEYLF